MTRVAIENCLGGLPTRSTMLTTGTPIEKHKLGNRTIYVKREDLSCPLPGPPFSKMRGVIEHIAARPEKVFGVLDTYHSKAGWAVAYACQALGKKCVNYYPVYKSEVEKAALASLGDWSKLTTLDSKLAALRESQKRSKALGAKLVAVPAGRSFILYNRVRSLLPKGAYLMPNALKLAESVEATAREVVASKAQIRRIAPQHVVISVSSGTIAAGVLAGLARIELRDEPTVWLHLGYTREEAAVRAYVEKASGVALPRQTFVIDEGYAYKDTAPASVVAPFPCNKWYDLKAWGFMEKQLDNLPGNILFWSVGD